VVLLENATPELTRSIGQQMFLIPKTLRQLKTSRVAGKFFFSLNQAEKMTLSHLKHPWCL